MKQGKLTTPLIREKNQLLNSVGTADLLDYVKNADEQHDVIIKLVKRLQEQQNHESISKNNIIYSKSGRNLHWKHILLKVNEAHRRDYSSKKQVFHYP